MERELKIVLIIVLTYLLFALGTWFNSGSFLAPVLLSKLLFFIFSGYLLLLHRKEKHAFLLLLYTAAMFFYLIIDDFTQSYLELRVFEKELAIYQSAWLAPVSFSLLFAALLLSLWKISVQVHKVWTLVLSTSLMAGLSLLFLQSDLGAEISFKLYFWIFAILSLRLDSANQKVTYVLGCQFLLLAALESFEYFI